MKQFELAKWLKTLIIISALIGLVLCFVIVPIIGKDAVLMNPDLEYIFYPSLIFIWITGIPFYIALWKSWSIASEIGKDRSFCKENADSLKTISRLALVECVLYFSAIISLLILNLLHPGLLLMALSIIFLGVAVAVAAAALSHLVEKANRLQEENDLTI